MRATQVNRSVCFNWSSVVMLKLSFVTPSIRPVMISCPDFRRIWTLTLKLARLLQYSRISSADIRYLSGCG